MCRRGSCPFNTLRILKVYKLIAFLKTLQSADIKTGTAEKSSPGTRQTDGKNLVWFGEIERKLAKLSMPTFTYRSSC
jgi:hypothetical protein